MDQIARLRRTIIETAARAGEGHIPSALSILDILWVLYDRVLRIDYREPKAESRDRFILSKGHGCLALYAVLADKRFFPEEWLDRFCKSGAQLDGHPDALKIPGVEATTGSLGHGLPIAIGMALALKIKRSPAHVYCLIGDQEALEGTTWEAAAIAAHHRLSNLTLIVDHNRSSDDVIHMGSIGRKFEAFGWIADEIDGHNHFDLEVSLTRKGALRPSCVVADTVKGCGCGPMEQDPRAWHHRAPTAAELPMLLAADLVEV